MSRRALIWTLGIGFFVVWPVAVAMCMTPVLDRFAAPSANASAAELQQLFGVRRFILRIPEAKDGWTLGLAGFVDGEQTGESGAVVEGGSEVVLLIARQDEPRLNYCWRAGSRVVHGSLPNPFVDAGVSTERPQGSVRPGDWLIRGGRDAVSGDGPADFELRVTLAPPDDAT